VQTSFSQPVLTGEALGLTAPRPYCPGLTVRDCPGVTPHCPGVTPPEPHPGLALGCSGLALGLIAYEPR